MGGVLLDWNPRHLYRKLIADPQEMERFLATVTTTPWHGLQDAGGDPAEATRRLKAEHPGKEALIEAFYGRFDEMLEHPFPEMAALVERLHGAGTPLYLLSNAPGFLDAWLRGPAQRRHPFFGRFRDYVVSGRRALPEARRGDLRPGLPHRRLPAGRGRADRRQPAQRRGRARLRHACRPSPLGGRDDGSPAQAGPARLKVGRVKLPAALGDLPRPLYFFDGYCVLCSGFVAFCLARDPEGRLKFASAQSALGSARADGTRPAGRHFRPDDPAARW